MYQIIKGKRKRVKMSRNDERFLMKVVDMYYKEEMSQEKIAKKLNVSRTTISRALSKAKKEGFVKIIIDFPAENSIELEKKLEDKYQMKEVIAVRSGNSQASEYLVAKEAALYLARVIKSNMLLGVTWGKTMKRIVDAFDSDQIGNQMKVKGVEVVPMLGTTFPETADKAELRLSYSSLLSNKLAEMVNGISYSLPAPMYVRNLETKRVFLEEPQIEAALNKARNCQVVIFGIGTMSEHSSLAALDSEKKDMILSMSQKGGAGELIGRVFDHDGNAMTSEIDERLIGLTLEEIRCIPTRVGVAYGTEKTEAIHAAVKSGIINVLITDSLTAEQLMIIE